MQFYHFFEEQRKTPNSRDGSAYLFLQKDLNLGWPFVTAGHRELFKIDQCRDFIIVNAENSTLHKYIVQNSRSTFRAISDVLGHPDLIPSQNSLIINDIQ